MCLLIERKKNRRCLYIYTQTVALSSFLHKQNRLSIMECKCIKARYVLTFMAFWGNFISYVLKINMSVAIVEMANTGQLENQTDSRNNDMLPDVQNSTTDFLNAPVDNSTGFQCPDRGAEIDAIRAKNISESNFQWTGKEQGLILGSYSYGVVALLIPMSILGQRYGHVRVEGIATLCASVFTLIIPIVVEKGGYVPLVILRILIGMCTGSTVTQMYALAGIWAPIQERSKIVSFIFAGIPIGISCANTLAGFLASWLGWRSVFYVTGALAGFWAVAWLLLIHERPEHHPRISKTELEYINSSVNNQNTKKSARKVPWKKIYKSGPYICLVTVHFCSMYGRQKFSAVLPTYLKEILKLNVEMSGILSAVPFALNGIFLFVCGPLADYVVSKGVRTIYVRKTLTGIGMLISASAVLGFSFCGCNVALAVTLSTITITMEAFTVPGFKSCVLEIAPEYSGVLFGISATIANMSGILAPQLTGILRDAYGFLGWQIAFWISSIVYLLGATLFCVFGTNEKQAWSEKPKPAVTTITEDI